MTCSKSKGVIEMEFESPAQARKALKIIKTKEFSEKISLSLKAKGNKLEATVKSKSFALMRARITSLLRDLKVVLDSIALVKTKK